MKFSSIALILSCISPILATNMTASNPRDRVTYHDQHAAKTVLFPPNTQFVKRDLKAFNGIIMSLIRAQKRLGARNPQFYAMFEDSVKAWVLLRADADNYTRIDQRHLFIALERLKKPIVNVIARKPTLDNKKALSSVMSDILSLTGFISYSIRGSGNDIPLSIMEAPAELFGIILRFLAYDVQKTRPEITMPLRAGTHTFDYPSEEVDFDPH